jgi:DnaK suppressor protein
MAQTDTRIAELRQVLVAQRRHVLSQAAQHEDELRWLDEDVEPEIVEEGQEAMLARLLARLDDRERDAIAAIDRALARIALGEYGLCTDCGTAILFERLRVLPAAELCFSCAEAREASRRK